MLFRRRDRVGPPEPSYPLDTPPGDGHPSGSGLAGAGRDPRRGLPAGDPGAARRRTPTGRSGSASRRFDRGIDQLWRRTSYSGLTEAVHARPPIALTAEAVVDDEPATAVPGGRRGWPGVPSPMAELPGGAAFGSLVHQVLENLDWYAPDAADEPALAERLLEATTAAAQRYPVPGVTPEALGAGMLPSLLTPLGRPHRRPAAGRHSRSATG